MTANRPQGLTRELIAMRIARELQDGMTVNLGIGLPTLVANFIPEGQQIVFQAENGILGYGGIVQAIHSFESTQSNADEFDQDLINAGGQPVSILPGASFFGSDVSFAMIRGGHVDVSVLGGLQVSEQGDLANWIVPERGGGSIGGAMDLAAGAKRLIVAMEHVTPRGEAKILRRCSYPLTAQRCVDLVVTDLALIEVTPSGLLLREVAPGVAPEAVEALTEAPLRRAPDLREMEL